MLERGREAVAGILNSEGRSGAHVLAGLAVCAGAVALSALLAARGAGALDRAGLHHEAGRDVVEPPKSLVSLVGPALLSAATLSAVRVWNAPSSPARTRALGLWGGIQALNGLWMAIRPQRLASQVAAAMAVAGVTAAYAHEARKLDKRAATIVPPVVGRVGLGNLIQDVRRRGAPAEATLH